MQKINSFFEAKYKTFKRQPFVFLSKPYLILFLPALPVIYLLKRWNSPVQEIFLTETFLKDINVDLEERNFDYTIKKINDVVELQSIADLRMLEDDQVSEYRELVNYRIRKGDFVYALITDKIIVSYVFISLNEADLSQVDHTEKIEDKCFAIYDVYTFKEYRGKHYYKKLLLAVCNLMEKEGYVLFWLWLMKHNLESVKVHDKLNINHVIKEYCLFYRFGRRNFLAKKVDYYLRDLS